MLGNVGDDTRAGTGLTRRDFLQVGGLGTLGLSLPAPAVGFGAGGRPTADRAVIWLMLVGGPSQLETWDPKPDAPSEVRGPYRTMETSVPGVRINEHLPKLARRMGRLTLVRSLHHDSAPIHETGLQLLQTGRPCRDGQEQPHAGSVAARLLGSSNGLPPFVILPGPIGNTGVAVSHGQTAGPLGPAFEPFHLAADPASGTYDPSSHFDRARRFHDQAVAHGLSGSAPTARTVGRAFDPSGERDSMRDAYGRNTFGQSCLLARRLVEAGSRFVTVNMFDTVFDRVTWDCHGARPFSTLDDYGRTLLPTFDAAFSALIDDLERLGRLDSTLVVATGEFGRTPRVNAKGGRDHWPGVWSAALAGGGVRGGQVVGASDAHASAPADRPVSPPELLATVYRSLGIDPSTPLVSADGGETLLPGRDLRLIGKSNGPSTR